MCLKLGALTSVSILHSSFRFKPAGLTLPVYTSTRSIALCSSIWDIFNLQKRIQRARKRGKPTITDRDSNTAKGKGFGNKFLAMSVSDVLDVNAPIDRQRFHAQFITTPTADTPGTTIVVHFNSRRYLFGRVAEGTQRACTERGVPLKKARNIFLTGETRWGYNSGLLGMILTMADFKVETNEEEQDALGQIRIHGGPKLWHSIACARRFIFRTGMPLRVFEADINSWTPSSQPDFIDENLLLWALPIQRSTTSSPTPRASDRGTVEHEQGLRQKTVHDMFDSDWRKDKLHEAIFKDINLPAMIWLRDPVSKALQATFCTKMSDAPHIKPDQKVLVRMPWPAALIAELPPADNLPSSVAMSYIAKGRPQRGSFMPQKAIELGVPKGPLFGALAKGQSITTEDGRTITPDQVMEPVLPSQGVAVLDVQDIHYLPDLLRKLQALKHGQTSNLHAFLWILGAGVFDSSEFTNFCQQFPEIQHVVSSADNNSNYLAMASSAASAARLNQIRPETFPVPRHKNKLPVSSHPDNSFVRAQRGLIMELAPRFKYDSHDVPEDLDIPAVVKGLSAETRALIPPANDSSLSTDEKYRDVSITTLGTGSAVPSKYRNVSANLIHIPSLGYFILDAGENTIGQLRRLYSPDELDEILCNLHLIWISHLHADHHLGTVSLLIAHKEAVRKRREAGSEIAHKLYLVSERNMADYLEDYKSIEASDAVMLHCLSSDLTDVAGNAVNVQDTTMPISTLETTRVSHCHGAQAVSITFSNGFKISYSGDCRPSATFAGIGQDSDVLIHEATFDDGMEGDAMAKKHCTIGEALGVATAMRAKNVILTHFSQRYQKLPTLTDVRVAGQLDFEDASDNGDIDEGVERDGFTYNEDDPANQEQQNAPQNGSKPPAFQKQNSLQEIAQKMSICVAFDLMRVTIPQIKDMYKYYPAIEHMFEVEQQKSDAKREALNAANVAILQAKEKLAEERKAKHLARGGDQKPKKDKKNSTNHRTKKSLSGGNLKADEPSPQKAQDVPEQDMVGNGITEADSSTTTKHIKTEKHDKHSKKRRKLTNEVT